MIVIDTGPLIALIDSGQQELHQKCVATHQTLVGPLLTTWPCFTEAMYFLYQLRGWSGQAALWDFVTRDALLLHTRNGSERRRRRHRHSGRQFQPSELT